MSTRLTPAPVLGTRDAETQERQEEACSRDTSGQWGQHVDREAPVELTMDQLETPGHGLTAETDSDSCA